MIEGYKFVYSLLDNGSVFYIGCAKDVLARYKQHINLYGGTDGAPMRLYLKEMIDDGRIPELEIIDYLPSKEALKLEAQAVSIFSRSGHKLINTVHVHWTFHRRVSMPSSPSKEDYLTAAKYKTEYFLHWRLQQIPSEHNKRGWKPAPINPFKQTALK